MWAILDKETRQPIDSQPFIEFLEAVEYVEELRKKTDHKYVIIKAKEYDND
jgi:hypothetical protein